MSERVIAKTIRFADDLMADIEAECAARGGIDVSAFVRIAAANEIRRERAARVREGVEEAHAGYGQPAKTPSPVVEPPPPDNPERQVQHVPRGRAQRRSG